MYNFTSLVGLITITYIFFHWLRFLWTIFRCYALTSIGFVKDLRKYGEWVVVTGATDGIGKEYARQFAKQGFKIVLISRSKEKLEKVSEEITTDFNVETKIICYDFTKTDGYDEIEEVIKELDVGILVNNVAMSLGEKNSFFHSSDISSIDNMLCCNIFSDVRMTHMILRGMINRQRGLILHLSSGVIHVDLPIPIYSSTKVFIQKFFNTLQLEDTGIDHQLVIPGYVATNMSKRNPEFTIPTAEEYVKSAIRTIGIVDVTCGCLSHDIQSFLFLSLPKPVQAIVSKLIAKHIVDVKKKES